ncbi:MAG: hypothetical protein M3320_09790, partial [Actinomycetota bacterium]|nr:hypothetical protein [Actinomycetota bacterium]
MRILAPLLVLLLTPSAAPAATVEMRQGPIDQGDRYSLPSVAVELSVIDDRGERNVLRIDTKGNSVVVRDDAAELVPRPGCSPVDEHTVACATPHPPTVTGQALLGAGDDVVEYVGGSLFVDGGPGDDDLRSFGAIRGGA